MRSKTFLVVSLFAVCACAESAGEKDKQDVELTEEEAAEVKRLELLTKLPSLHASAAKGDIEMVKTVLDLGADVNAEDGDSIKPANWSSLTSHWVAKAGPMAMAELWDAKSAMVGSLGSTGDRPLHRAAYGGSAEAASLLIQHGADVNARNERGWAPLHTAALSGHEGVIRVLLAAGADVNARDNEGVVPLHMAAEQRKYEVAKFLLFYNADVNARDNAGITPLHWATFSADRSMMKLLLSKGARVNARDNNALTPKRWAAIHVLRAKGHDAAVNTLWFRGGVE